MATSKITLFEVDGTKTVFAPSTETRQFGRVKDWWEWTPNHQNVFDYNGHGVNIKFMAAVRSLPALANQKAALITKEIAERMFWVQKGVMPLGTPDSAVKSTLSHLCGGNIAITNNLGLGLKHGNRLNPWLPEENVNGERGLIGVLPVYTVGSVVEIIGEQWIPGAKDNDCYVIRAFDAQNPFQMMNLPYFKNEHLYWKATTVARVPGLPHGQRLGPFPQAGLPVIRDPKSLYTRVLMPIMTNGDTNGIGNGWCKMFIPKYLIDLQPIGTLAADVYPYGVP